MIKLTVEQPVYIAIQVNVQVNVWLACDGNSVPTEVKPDLIDNISLGRTIPIHKKLDKPLAIVVNVDDMSTRCSDAIGVRLLTKLEQIGH